jgi:ribosomal protein S18 acetylase RimI-like enzyme
VSDGVTADPVPRSLVWATDLDVLPVDRLVARRDGYLAARSPSNPTHYWGNLLLFDDPPSPGDALRWERLFDAEFASDTRARHRTFAWDRTDGALGCAREEFAGRGYELDETVGLVATPDRVRPHPRENREVDVRVLGSARGADEHLWEQVAELQLAGRGGDPAPPSERAFTYRRLEELRVLLRTGRGAWYVALAAGGDEVLASCGVLVTGHRGRFQSVDTATAHRRRGICSRLVVEATRRTAEDYGAQRFVIAADLHYHALGLYESLGFQPHERVCGVCHSPANV